MTTVAVVGVGRWGKRLLRVFDAHARVLSCCHRGTPATAQWLQAHYPHITRTVRFDDLLEDDRVEAVVLATPIDTHASMARRVLEAGKHVFVEKPLATTAFDARALVDLARAQGRILFVGHVFLFHPVLARLQQAIREDPVRYVVMRWAKWGTFTDDLLWNLVSHEVSLAIALFGGLPCSTTILSEHGALTSCDIVSLVCRFDEGRECAIHVNRCARSANKHLTAVTCQGRVFDWDRDTLAIFAANGDLVDTYHAQEEPLAVEVKAFLNALLTGSTSSGEEGCRVVEVVEPLHVRRETLMGLRP